MKLIRLLESALGIVTFDILHCLDEIGQNTEAGWNSVSDLNRFGKVVKLRSFSPHASASDASKQCIAVSEGLLTDEQRTVLETNLPKVKEGKKSKFVLGVPDPKIGSQIHRVTKIRCQSNEFVSNIFRGVRLHFDRSRSYVKFALKYLDVEKLYNSYRLLIHDVSWVKNLDGRLDSWKRKEG